MLVNGIECITLGHGIKNDPVASHSYFGSEQILKDLEKNSIDGVVTLRVKNSYLIKDSATGLVCGLNF